MAEHERMMELFFSAIVGDTFQIKKLDSPFPASHVAGEASQLSNVHGGPVVGYDDRAYQMIKAHAAKNGVDVGYHPCVHTPNPAKRQIPDNWRQEACV